jgi:hypothetical protein
MLILLNIADRPTSLAIKNIERINHCWAGHNLAGARPASVIILTTINFVITYAEVTTIHPVYFTLKGSINTETKSQITSSSSKKREVAADI